MKSENSFWKGFKRGASILGLAITTFVNSVLLFFVYIFGVGITSIIGKIAGKEFLDMRVSKKRESYWTDLNLGKEDMEDYYRQF